MGLKGRSLSSDQRTFEEIKSDQNGIERPSSVLATVNTGLIKSDQNGIERVFRKQLLEQEFPDKIRPKWD